MTYPVTGPPPASPSDQWMVSADDVLVMDMSMGDPGEPAASDADSLSTKGGRSRTLHVSQATETNVAGMQRWE